MKIKNYIPRLSVVITAFALVGVAAVARCPFLVTGKAPSHAAPTVASVLADAAVVER